MIRTAFVILSGNAAASIVLLVRNLAIARLIPVADYGIAATFAIVVSLLEMASTLGLQQQIIQSKRGDDPDFQSALQGFQLLRGVISGAILFALAGPIADFMDLPDVAWAYRILALVPIFNALQHFDIHRLSRQMAFWPMIATNLIPAAVSLALVWPLAMWLGDYRVMLWALLAQTFLMAVTSHLVASRRWRARLDRAVMGGALRFGWPLLLNNILLFAVFNGDRIVVARELGPAALGIFSMGITLTLTPTLVLAKSAQNFFLPQFGQAGDDPQARSRIASVAFEAVLAASLVFVLAMATMGPPFVAAVLGEKYAALMPLMTLFTVVQALRILKVGPSIAALADGRTANALIGNLPRVAVLPIIVWIAATTGSIETILLVAAAGELVGFAATLVILGRSAPDARRELVLCHAAGALALGALTVGATFEGVEHMTAVAVLGTLASIAAMGRLRRYLTSFRGSSR